MTGTPDPNLPAAPRRLGRRAQATVGTLRLGIVATSPDPADPAARINIADAGTGQGGTWIVRAGDTVRVGRHAVTFTEVVPGSRDGYVRFVVTPVEG
jgi:hypothetical protein